jgi:hypothetical protein
VIELRIDCPMATLLATNNTIRKTKAILENLFITPYPPVAKSIEREESIMCSEGPI